MDKKAKLMKIIQEIQDLYPHLDRLMVTDLDNPDSIIISSAKRIEEIASEFGVNMEEVAEFFEDDIDQQLDLLELGGNDNENKGPLQ